MNRKFIHNIKSDFLPPFLVFILFVGLWELSVVVFKIPEYLVSSPSIIIEFTVENLFEILKDFGITMYESIIGFIIGSAFGFIMAILFAHSRMMEKSLYPYMIALKAIPIVALAPLLVLWFGSGISGKIVMSALICFFPVIVNSTIGLKSVDKSEMDLFNSIASSKYDIFIKLRLPKSIPYVFSSLKIASTLSLVGAIVAEFSGAKSGLGYMMIMAIYQLDTASLYTGIIFTSIGGILFFRLVTFLESKIVHWDTVMADN